MEINDLVEKGMSKQNAYNQIRNRIVAEQSKLLGIQTKQTGGVIQSSVQDFNDVIENIGG